MIQLDIGKQTMEVEKFFSVCGWVRMILINTYYLCKFLLYDLSALLFMFYFKSRM